jgi:hypothetical protein
MDLTLEMYGFLPSGPGLDSTSIRPHLITPFKLQLILSQMRKYEEENLGLRERIEASKGSHLSEEPPSLDLLDPP